MDEFEREYFDKLKQLASDYSGKRRNLARSRIKMFVAAVCRQLLEENEKFDLIVTAGNSGLYMATITNNVYPALGIELPQLITLPIYRFKSDDGEKIAVNDNFPLQQAVSDKLANLPQKANVLFVDDEIMSGITVKTALEIILNKRSDLDSLRCLIIAENHFFEWHYLIPKVTINFFAYSRLIQGLNGSIGYFIPEDLYTKITAQIADVESYNHAMAIVLGGALKRKSHQGIPFFDTSVEDVCLKEVSGYEETKITLMRELKKLVSQAIEEYKNKEIQFRV